MSKATPATNRSRRAGFTLLELMVALTVGGIAISSIYAVGASTTRQFHQQQSVATAQNSLRAAFTRIKRDLARAGYLATPNVNQVDDVTGKPVEACAIQGAPLHDPTGTGSLAGVARWINDIPLLPGDDLGSLDPPNTAGVNATNGVSVDEIRLFANYSTSAEYAGIRLPTGDTDSILVPQTWHDYRRDFTQWHIGNTTHDNASFSDAFRIGRLARVMTTRRKKFFARITSVTHPGEPPQAADDPAIVNLAASIPNECLKDVDGGWIAPVSSIRYLVMDAPADEQRFAANTGPMAQLLRQETQPEDKVTPLPNMAATRTILDYVVAFNLEFQMTADTTQGQPDNYSLGVFTTDPAVVNANPELIRAVKIELAVRTRLPDKNIPPAVCPGLRCFIVFDPALNQGAARVRRLEAQVFLPNIAYEGY